MLVNMEGQEVEPKHASILEALDDSYSYVRDEETGARIMIIGHGEPEDLDCHIECIVFCQWEKISFIDREWVAIDYFLEAIQCGV